MARRRKPRWPGRAEIICTSRGAHDSLLLWSLQMVNAGGTARLCWDTRKGPAPITGFRPADGFKTFVFRCPVCGRNPRLGEAKLLQALRGLAEIQGTDGAAPVILDISKL
jgi:hypothetical protein